MNGLFFPLFLFTNITLGRCQQKGSSITDKKYVIKVCPITYIFFLPIQNSALSLHR